MIGKGVAAAGNVNIPASLADSSAPSGELQVALEADGYLPVLIDVKDEEAPQPTSITRRLLGRRSTSDPMLMTGDALRGPGGLGRDRDLRASDGRGTVAARSPTRRTRRATTRPRTSETGQATGSSPLGYAGTDQYQPSQKRQPATSTPASSPSQIFYEFGTTGRHTGDRWRARGASSSERGWALLPSSALGAAFWDDVFGSARSAARSPRSGYGPRGPANELGLRLPEGFRSRLIARGGEPVAGTDYRWHEASDGMACFATDDGGWILVSNSEVLDGRRVGRALRRRRASSDPPTASSTARPRTARAGRRRGAPGSRARR